ncbi:hypothetical protein [Candidatus Mycolicibacterium alkanivorans]|uniref:Uncharacterized protein n=1 Tax=Candidatus Mycolicibacterium alkanivorans TaxID=2954114 RepID=A0ABS9YSP4_9MYCO|nr:hypothetical protein [Candidatus Mycolicibacterium alkanivorans]MCI4673833.1 hypothetical protein [Candidatus Mycolicibacterium alkanivorans]
MSEADVDAMVLAVDPELPQPAIARDDVVLVTGPWLAGATGVINALRERLPRHRFVEAAEIRAGVAPVAMVFVVSATAPLTESDCALLDASAADTDAVIGVVTKIDVHRAWRQVLEADRTITAGHAPRYAAMAWVGAAAAPDLGAQAVDDLVAAVEQAVATDSLARRNRLRAWENRLLGAAHHYESEVVGEGREVRLAALRERRAAEVRRARLDKTERAIAVRAQMQQARLQLSYFARNRCASVRTELQEDAASATRRTFGAFTDYVRRRIGEVVEEVDDGTAQQLSQVGLELGLPIECPAPPALAVEVPAAPLRSRRVETRLMALLGAGFGLGVALTLSRLLADLAPQWTAAGVVACAVIGVLLTLWVVGTRGLLHDRAVLDRWVAGGTSGLRAALEERVASWVLAAESALGIAAAERDAAQSVRVDQVLAGIDREIHQLAVTRAHAVAERDLHMPVIERALAVVRVELAPAVGTDSTNRPI